MTKLLDGWHDVTTRTKVRYQDGEPVRIRTTARDLDSAIDATAQFVGEPLETGGWEGTIVDGKYEGPVETDCHRSALDHEEDS